MEQLIRTISNVKRKINPGLQIAGNLITMAGMRTNYPQEIIELLRNTYGEKLRIFDSIIPLSIRAAETNAEGGYEIVSGHRRKRGSELAGRDTMPVLVRELDDDEATIIMVDSNLQREKLLPSEKAFAYKMKLDALKHQGQRRDLTSAPAVPKLTAREQIARDARERSGMAVTRYISLTKLIPPLLVMVDEEKIAVSAAADYITDLTESEQRALVDVMKRLDIIGKSAHIFS